MRITNICMKDSIRNILQTIQQEDPEHLQEVHAKMDELNRLNPQDAPHDPVFEIDDKMHKIPFQQLRQYLMGSPQAAAGSVVRESEVANARNRMKAAAPQEVYDYSKQNSPERSGSGDGGYYWDTNTNYEYMNPEAQKEKVLGKIKK